MKVLRIISAMVCLVGCTTNIPEEDLVNNSQLVSKPDQMNGNGANEISYNGELVFIDQKVSDDVVFDISVIEKPIEDITFRAKRIPTDLYLMSKGIPSEDLDSVRQEVEGEQLFYFEFEENRKLDLVEKYFSDDLDASISYMSFTILNDFTIQNEAGKSIDCSYTLYERNFHVAPFERLIISFSGVDTSQELKLVYQDKLFGKGKMEFSFPSAEFINNNINNPS